MSLVALPAGVDRAYKMFELVSNQWKPGKEVTSDRNKEAYYKARRHLVYAIHEAMTSSTPPFPWKMVNDILADVDMEFEEILFYVESVTGSGFGQHRVHVFYGGDSALDLDEGEVAINPLGKGHGHLMLVVNNDGKLATSHTGRRSARERTLVGQQPALLE